MKAIGGIIFALLIAFFFYLRADDPVNLSGDPPTPPVPLDAGNAHGRLEINYVLVPPDKLAAFADAFDPSHTVADLGDVLKATGGKVVARASTSLVLGGDGAMLEIADSRLTLRPRVASATAFHLEGRLTRASFSGSFDVLLTPGMYQLFISWDQPPRGGAKDPYNAIVARMREITLEGPNGDVHTLHAEQNPPPAPQPPQPMPPIPPAPPPLPKVKKVLYENRGNTKGFGPGFAHPSFTPHDTMLVANDPASGCPADASGWMSIPAWLTGDFQIDLDVRADANDAMSWVMLYDDATRKGLFVCNRTNTSFGDPTHSIVNLTDVTTYDQIFNHGPGPVLASANALKFPNQTWTHVTITKVGNRLFDSVGGQVLTAEIPHGTLSAKIHVGLGYYATKNVGGNGQMEYANIRMAPQQ